MSGDPEAASEGPLKLSGSWAAGAANSGIAPSGITPLKSE